MLERLSIRDFAVARSVAIEPGGGLVAFTGETGAGKSLIVDALAFVFGGRRGREVIAAGAERATVEAVIQLDSGSATIERSIGLSARSSARLDGQAATLDQLQRLGELLVDIHGQSEQLAILRPSVQLAVLDSYAGLTAAQRELAAGVRQLREVRRQLAELQGDARERERLVDQLRFEAGEIEAAGLQLGEDEQLRAEQGRLSGVGRLLEDAGAALQALDEAPLGEIVRALQAVASRDAEAAGLAGAADLLEAGASDLARDLRRYRDGLDEDPERLAVVEERLDLIARLRRKYGETVPDMLGYLERANARLALLTSATRSADELETAAASLRERLAREAQALGEGRRGAAGRLVREIADELEQLGMRSAALAVGFACEDDVEGLSVSLPDYEVILAGESAGRPAACEALPRAFTEWGVDRIELLASFNAGEAPRPLSAVASGGETSRFLLALTTVLGRAGPSRLVVFDEVDEGVGGRAGALVGAALAELAKRHQVLCITHLPQVAAFADRHFVVTKQSDGARTWSEIRLVENDERVDELAAMLGAMSEATRSTARELLEAARR